MTVFKNQMFKLYFKTKNYIVLVRCFGLKKPSKEMLILSGIIKRGIL